MNLCIWGMSLKEYCLKFTKFYKYAPILVANSRYRINMFLMLVSSFVEEQCHTTMLHYDMDMSRSMVYAQQIEETHLWKMNRNGKRARLDEPRQP